MNNGLYRALQGQSPAAGGIGNLISQFQQFRQQFRGDPRQQVQQLLNSGKITQAQYNQAVQRAQALQKILGGGM